MNNYHGNKDKYQNSQWYSDKLVLGYSQWLQRYVDEKGWNPFFLTFMYKPLREHTEVMAHQMKDEVDRVYSTFITRVVRNPKSEHQQHLRPLLIAVPDRPVAKYQKQRLKDITINNGRHMHGILVVPWDCRLKRDVRDHFEKYRALYLKNRLLRLDVRPIQSDLLGLSIIRSNRSKAEKSIAMIF